MALRRTRGTSSGYPSSGINKYGVPGKAEAWVRAGCRSGNRSSGPSNSCEGVLPLVSRKLHDGAFHKGKVQKQPTNATLSWISPLCRPTHHMQRRRAQSLNNCSSSQRLFEGTINEAFEGNRMSLTEKSTECTIKMNSDLVNRQYLYMLVAVGNF